MANWDIDFLFLKYTVKVIIIKVSRKYDIFPFVLLARRQVELACYVWSGEENEYFYK